MLKVTLSADFKDHRGTITDLVSFPVDAVTIVATKTGCIRGNHLHKLTEQWAYVLSGRLLVTTGSQEVLAEPGDLVFNPRGEPHAWQALEDTVCVVVVDGPRAGHNYESDVYRLEQPILS